MATYPNFRRVVDVMKKTKDTVTGQLTTAEKQNLIACLATANITHIAISIPLATNAEFVAAGRTPSPRTLENEWLDWCNVIHAEGLGVLFRPAFPGIEQQTIGTAGLYNMALRVGVNRFAAGTRASVAAGDYASWCGRQYQFIAANPGCFNDTGPNPDVWAVAPERNESKSHYSIYDDARSPLPHSSPGIQANYVNFFNNLHLTAQDAFTAIGKPGIITQDTAINYHDARNGWMPTSLFANQNRIAVDYYGNYDGSGFSAEAYVSAMEAIYNIHGRRVAWQEYGPIETDGQPMATRAATLRTLLDLIHTRLVLTGKLEEFGAWMGWEGQNTSMLNKSGSGASSVYTLNELGLEIQRFFGNIVATLEPPEISAFGAAPGTFRAGQAVTLSWDVQGATSLSIDNGIGTVTGLSRQVSPTATTTYVLTATNAAGSVTQSVTVTFDPTPVTPTTRIPYSQRPVFGGVWPYAGEPVTAFTGWRRRTRSADGNWNPVNRST